MNTAEPSPRVLLVEDDELMVHLIRKFLEDDGFVVASCATGEEGLARARADAFDVLLLDVDLPGMSGVDVLHELRRDHDRVPVLIVSADADKRHIARSLDEGADDYVPKPVDPAELPARIRAVLRRHRQTAAPPRTLLIGDISFDEARRSLAGPQGDVSLTATEAALLRELAAATDRLVSAYDLQLRIWGTDSDAESSVVAVHISRLRSKLGKVGSGITIRAKRGIGYQMDAAS